VVAASSNEFAFVVIDFSDSSSPTVVTIRPDLGGGSTVFCSQVRVCAGAILGTTIKLYGLSGNTVTLIGSADSRIDSIATLAFIDFASSHPGGGGGGTPGPGGGGGVIPPQPHPRLRPLSLRRFMASKGLDPASGLRVIRPPIRSVAEFILFP
jgi:hypothetical protein